MNSIIANIFYPSMAKANKTLLVGILVMLAVVFTAARRILFGRPRRVRNEPR